MKQNKTALIGGSSGIGKSIAIRLAKEGVKVCINFSKSKDKALEVKKEIENLGGIAIIYKADITQEDQVEGMFEFLSSEFGTLDILINNAGIYIPDFIETHDVTTWDAVMNLNLKAKLLCTKYAIPLLKKSSEARIINIATRAASQSMEESSAYCCAATGIVMLSKVSALELSKYSIKVNTISPGLTRTPMTEAVDPDEEFDNYAKKNPSGRVGLPEDIANTVNFLVSQEAEFINGENINVSGGILL